MLGEYLNQKIHYHFKNIWMVNLHDVCLHIMTEKHLLNRDAACISILVRHEQLPFRNRNIIGKEKWISYNNVALRRSWSVPG